MYIHSTLRVSKYIDNVIIAPHRPSLLHKGPPHSGKIVNDATHPILIKISTKAIIGWLSSDIVSPIQYIVVNCAGLAMLLFCVVLVFFLCNILALVVNILEVSGGGKCSSLPRCFFLYILFSLNTLTKVVIKILTD